MRDELAPLGVDVTLVNPGLDQTGFNDRMADSMWDWFSEKSVNGQAYELFRMVGELARGAQLDPDEVTQLLIRLVEADVTAVNNFSPPDILEQVKALVGQ